MSSLAPRATISGTGAAGFAFGPARGPEAAPRPHKRSIIAPAAASELALPTVDFRPAAVAIRRSAAWAGLRGEIVRLGEPGVSECYFRGPSHLLIAYQRATRRRGESTLDGVPRSTLQDLSGKLTLVPAGTSFHERHDRSGPLHAIYIYIDSQGPLLDRHADATTAPIRPHLLFDNRILWELALRLAELVEDRPSACRFYAQALGVVLAHELSRLDAGTPPSKPALQGGLASWQLRIVDQYIEGNLASQISLTKLSEMARLSPYHFARSFKRSVGMPPHRYHMHRRIHWAKLLLAEPSLSVTDIAHRIGFADTSSFSVAFRNLVGRPPMEYRRSLP